MNCPLKLNGNMMNIAYLACPYSHPDPEVKKKRYHIVTRVAFDLKRQGIFVYSPLTHNIPIGQFGIPEQWTTWKSFDHEMLARCDRLIVLKLPGWEESEGVNAEVACAKERGLSIEWMEISEETIQSYSTHFFVFKSLLERMLAFSSERDWDKFHSPKNLAMNLAIEVSELMEHFCWLTESQSFVESSDKLNEIRDEIGDVFLVLLRLSHTLRIDPLQAAHDKLSKIAEKYPIEKCKGLSCKYTEYETIDHA